VTKIVLAMNVATGDEALAMMGRIGNKVDVYKLGIDLFARTGPALVREFTKQGCDVFLDLKYSDIPSVVGKAVEAAAELDVAMLTVHTMGGPAMLKAAAEAAAKAKGRKPLVLGVTVLTSLDAPALERISGKAQPVAERVKALAVLAKESGCGGCVSSPQEIGVLKQACGPEFKVVTPGIRLGPGTKDDQARTLTPKQAAEAGADYIVVGRPIYDAPDPMAAIAEIRGQMGGN
jgi:orotidine-5'-phosphate decarboxylase